MKSGRHAGFYLSVEDFYRLERILNLLADFVAIVVDQTVEELDWHIAQAKNEIEAEDRRTHH